MDADLRQRLFTRWGQLKRERASWDAHWKDIAEVLLPRSGRFFVQDRNRGERRHNAIYDSSGTRALRTLAAGLMSGMTSPARPWFRLAVSDQALGQSDAVKTWLADVERIMRAVFNRSNTYRALHTLYEELGAFGSAACIVETDFNTIVHHYPLAVGEYCIATNWRGEVDTLYRELQKTVRELVAEFGIENVSQTVRGMFERGSLDQWVTVIHAIEPRRDRDPNKRDNLNMPFRSVYFELGSNPDRVLRESGYRRFPALCPRWAVSGGDVYGSSPGMEALGDIKQLQHEQLRKAQCIDFQTKPPLQVPASMKNRDVEMLPGGISYVDMAGPESRIRSAFDVNLRLDYLLADIQDVRSRIDGAFYADLFLMLQGQDTRMTATEVAERREEKLLMLGPVLERLQNELLDPLIDLTFDALSEASVLPIPPQELQGQDVHVELVSMLSQAQRAIATNSIDRFVANLGAVAQVKPEALDRLDADVWVETYADALGIDPRLVVPYEKVQALRQARAEAAAQAQKAQQEAQGAEVAQRLASARLDTPSALTEATRAFSGYN